MSEKQAFKHVGLIYKKADMSFEEFVDYWHNVHTKITTKLPNLRKYVVNPIDRREYPDSPIDGFSELWFDSIEDAQAAFASEIGQQAYNDVPNFAENVAVTYITETQKF